MQVSSENKAIEVVKVLSDDYSRKILLSVINNSLPIEEISKEQNIPVSTCYRRVHEMLAFGILKPERTIIREDGKKYICYRAAIKNATIRLESGELKVDVVLNRDPSDKLGVLWSNLRSGEPSDVAAEDYPKLETVADHVVQKSTPAIVA
jgi:DNA-binding Lrp family transcriptional regulator